MATDWQKRIRGFVSEEATAMARCRGSRGFEAVDPTVIARFVEALAGSGRTPR
jgi:hypothetical protein